MKSFWVGLVVGVVAGAGGTYVALENPFASDGDAAAATAPADAGPEPVAKSSGRKRKKRRRTAGEGAAGAPMIELSAADRKLVWRGDKVELGPRDMDMTSESGRSLDPGEISSGIQSRSSDVIACITEARGNAELSATITMKALVEGNGRVSKVRVRAPKYLVDNGVHTCIRRQAKSMEFAATGAQTVVTVPFDLY